MAYQPDPNSKSGKIRKYLEKHPDVSPKKLVDIFARKGVVIQSAQVCDVRRKLIADGVIDYEPKVGRPKKTKRRGRSRQTEATNGRDSGPDRPLERLTTIDLVLLGELKFIADRMGSIDQVRVALDTLAAMQIEHEG